MVRVFTYIYNPSMEIVCRVRPPDDPAEWRAYFHLRWQVLREPLGLEPGTEQDDLEKVATHAAAWSAADQVLAVGRLHTTGGIEGQIRYMAVDSAWQGLGVGQAVLTYLENKAREQGLTQVFLNAREPVVGFYEHCGYANEQEIDPLLGIPHRRMRKVL